MSDYISRAAAVSILHYNCDEKCSAVVPDMENIPSEDVAPVVHGKWNFAEDSVFRCSVCGRICYEDDAPYCYCGAKMDAE